MPLKPAELVAAWKRGDIDAGYVWGPFSQQLEADGGKEVFATKQLQKDGYLVYNNFAVRKAFAEKHPDIVVKFLRVYQEKLEQYQRDPEGSTVAIAKHLSIPVDTGPLGADRPGIRLAQGSADAGLSGPGCDGRHRRHLACHQGHGPLPGRYRRDPPRRYSRQLCALYQQQLCKPSTRWSMSWWPRRLPSLHCAPRLSPAWRLRAISVASVLAVLLLWQLSGSLHWIDALLLPPPAEVLRTTGELLESGYRDVPLWQHLATSVARALLAFAAAVLVGVPPGPGDGPDAGRWRPPSIPLCSSCARCPRSR